MVFVSMFYFSSFVFSVPTSLREKDSNAPSVPRRSRSIPVGLDDSDEEDWFPKAPEPDQLDDEFEHFKECRVCSNQSAWGCTTRSCGFHCKDTFAQFPVACDMVRSTLRGQPFT